jgi:hypothetical protein
MNCRSGQQPANLLLASVHFLLLGGTDHELKTFYPSIVGEAAKAPEGVGAPFRAFCVDYRDQIAELLATRLVQTTVVKRAAALRLGLSVISKRATEPLALLDIGAGTGAHLLFDRYHYQLGDQEFGAQSSQVTIESQWRSLDPVPDLDHLPAVGPRLGVDLHPVDLSDPSERHWLRALIWPENDHETQLLDSALAVVAVNQPEVVRGDILDVGTSIASNRIGRDSLVVFHAATRAHIPSERRDDFDNIIRNFADGRTVYWLSLEGGILPEPRRAGSSHILTLKTLQRGEELTEYLALVEGHGDWIEPLDL